MPRTSGLPADVVQALQRHGIRSTRIWAPGTAPASEVEHAEEVLVVEEPAESALDEEGGRLEPSVLAALGAYLGAIRSGLGSRELAVAASGVVRLGLSADAVGELAGVVEREFRRAEETIRRS